MVNNEYKQAASYLLSYVSESGFEFPTRSGDIKKELDYFQKEYAPENLEALDDSSILQRLFYTIGDNAESLCYHLEMNKECRSYFGSIAGGSAYKFGLFQKKETGKWTTGSSVKPQELTAEEATVQGKRIRDALVKGAYAIRNEEIFDLTSYERLDNELKGILGDQMYNWSWIHKYFSLICNDKLSGFHSNEWQYFVLRALRIKPSSSYYVRSGQISMVQNICGWYYRELFDVIIKRFGSPRQFLRIGTVANGNSFAAEWAEKNIVGIGWSALGDLSAFEDNNKVISKDGIQSRLKELYYPGDEKTASRKAGEMIRFYKADKGTVFVVMDGERLLALAEGQGDYFFDATSEMAHQQHANWKYVFEKEEKLPFRNEGKLTTCNPITNDDNLLFLYDRFYYGINSETNQKSADTQHENDYWPSLSEYDPGISKGLWKKLLLEDWKVYGNTKRMLKGMLDLGGEATCKKLGESLNIHASACISRGNSLGRRIKKKLGLPPCMDKDGERFFPVAFVGRHVMEDGMSRYSWRLRDPLKEALLELDEEGFFDMGMDEIMKNEFSHNTILYGPPGTGKTYNAVIYAVAICDDRSVEDVKNDDYGETLARYYQLKNAGRIIFTTFHQSYGYEEFIEGIRPVMADDEENGGLEYVIADGIFKNLCKAARTPETPEVDYNASIWFIWLKDKGSNDLKTECFHDGEIRFDGPENPDEEFDWAYTRLMKMKPGDFILTYYGSSTVIDGVGIVQDGELTFDRSRSSYNWTRKVKWLITEKQIDVKAINNNKYLPNFNVSAMNHMNLSDLLRVVEENSGIQFGSNEKPYVMIIDEINRGNISKIFGELITLIEDRKRAGSEEAMEAVLPYSGEVFSVPNNVYILGTMNTADRSIALMDTALRRRFSFAEMMPNPSVLKELGADVVADGEEVLDVARMLEVINTRIEYLYDREHTIGHAFFTKLADDPSIETLASIFEKKVIPLLQEYFYEDYEKIQLVLGDNEKPDEYKFILDREVKTKDVFNGNPDVDLPEKGYGIQKEAFLKIRSYKLIGKDL